MACISFNLLHYFFTFLHTNICVKCFPLSVLPGLTNCNKFKTIKNILGNSINFTRFMFFNSFETNWTSRLSEKCAANERSTATQVLFKKTRSIFYEKVTHLIWMTVPNFIKYISTNHSAEQFASKSKAKQTKMYPQNRAFYSYVS